MRCGLSPRRSRRRCARKLNHADLVALIEEGVGERGGRWADLGAGEGAFTLALAGLLGPEAHVTAIDKDAGALQSIQGRFEVRVADVTRTLWLGGGAEDEKTGDCTSACCPCRPRWRRIQRRIITLRRSSPPRPPPPGLKRLVTPSSLAPQVTYFLNRSSASRAMPIRCPRVSSRNRAMRPAAAPSFSSGVEPSLVSGSVPMTTIWSSSTATSTPENQPSGSLPANQPLIDPSSFSSMYYIIKIG